MANFIFRKKDETWSFTYFDGVLVGFALLICFWAYVASGNTTAYKRAFESIESGMTKAQVIDIMGKPNETQYGNEGELRLRWISRVRRGGNPSAQGTFVIHFYVYLNQNNKVYRKQFG